jgi:hypothetical protein
MLIIPIVGRAMQTDFHCIVKNSADSDQVRAQDPIEKKMPWLSNDAAFMSRAFATVTKVIAQHMLTDLGTVNTSCALRHGGYIAHGCHQQTFVPQLRELSELVASPRKYVDNVKLSCG